MIHFCYYISIQQIEVTVIAPFTYYSQMSSVGSNYILKDSDVPHLVMCLESMSFKWEVLGLALHLSQSVREQCRSSSNILSLEKILSEWMNGHGLQPASLGLLVKALDSKIVGHERLAKNLIPQFKILVGEASPSLPECSHSNELAAQSDSTKSIGGISASFTGSSSKQDSSRKSMPPCLNWNTMLPLLF